MDNIASLIANLDGLSLIIGLAAGSLFGVVIVLLTRYNLNKTFRKALDEQKSSFEGVSDEMKTAFGSLSAEALKDTQASFLNLANDKFGDQRERHNTELESKKELIDTQLQQMSETLKTVPNELGKSQKNVGEIIEKSAKNLEVSNKVHLTQLQERSDTQTKEHIAKLEEKELLINRRLSEMDDKLGKVQKLIDEFEKARESKLGALDDQLKNLTQTTSSLQKALADNRARGQWGERIAQQILEHLGLQEGLSYRQQMPTPSGERPDFTFFLPNQLSLNMDCKFPSDNYLRYSDAENEIDRNEYSKIFIRNVEKHVVDISKKDYINSKTVDCVLIFIPNEQIYRFIHEHGSTIIDTALRNKIILCSPLTLYIVLAVVRQAAESFALEQRSREIFAVINDIRQEWLKYTDHMDGMEKNFAIMERKFRELTGTRTRQLDRKFDKIDTMLESSDLLPAPDGQLPQLPEDNN